jgi:YD repeat-containing protein
MITTTRSPDGQFEIRHTESRSDQDYDYQWEIVHVASSRIVATLTGHWYFNGVGVTSAGGTESVRFNADGRSVETTRYTGSGQGDTEPGERIELV